MDEGWEDATAVADEASSAVIYRAPRTQREADAIFARLRRWRDQGQNSS